MATEDRSKTPKRFVKVLRQTRAVPRLRRSRQNRALIDAIRYGDSSLAIWLLKQGVDANATDNKNRSALWWAAHQCRLKVMPELLKRGARLPDDDDVLFGPVEEGDEKSVRLLIRHGANVNCYGSRYTPVGHHRLVKSYLLSTAMCRATLNKRESIPIMLIRAGAKINQLTQPYSLPLPENRSMLGLAAYYGLIKTVRAMIKADADVNIRDNRGRTPLLDALEQGHIQVAKALLKAGAEGRRPFGDTRSAAAAHGGSAGDNPPLKRTGPAV